MAWLQLLLAVHAVATVAMTGLIWFVQVVHYPLFAMVGSEGYGPYQHQHMRRTTYVVLPLMFVELATAMLLLASEVASARPGLVWLGLGLVVVIWLATFFLAVPCHHRLTQGFDASAHRKLVLTNWLRTGAWSARSIIAMVLVSQ